MTRFEEKINKPNTKRAASLGRGKEVSFV